MEAPLMQPLHEKRNSFRFCLGVIYPLQGQTETRPTFSASKMGMRASEKGLFRAALPPEMNHKTTNLLSLFLLLSPCCAPRRLGEGKIAARFREHRGGVPPISDGGPTRRTAGRQLESAISVMCFVNFVFIK